MIVFSFMYIYIVEQYSTEVGLHGLVFQEQVHKNIAKRKREPTVAIVLLSLSISLTIRY